MTDLTALIQRLEQAKGSADLDYEIHWLVTGGVGVGTRDEAPHYTRSIDAAMTLVPEGMAVDLHIGPRALANDAVVTEPVQSIDDQDRRVTSWKQHEARAARDGTLHWNTPALALCLASLRARQQQQQEER